MGLEPAIIKELRKMEQNGVLNNKKVNENSVTTNQFHTHVSEEVTDKITDETFEHITYDDFIFHPDWQIEKTSTNFYYKNGVIPGKIFFSELGGNITTKEVEEALPQIKKAFIEGEFENTTYIRIVDYSHVENASIQARRKYGQFLTDLNESHNAHAKLSFICGASRFLKMALTLFANHVKQHFIFVKTVEEAFEQINQHHIQDKKTSNEEKTVSQKEINGLIDMCGDILWDEKEAYQKGENSFLSSDSPLYPLAESLSILNQDLKELRVKDEEKTTQLISMNEELQDAQDALQTVNAHLHRKVEEKTANIQKLVEQKDDFIHMLSHDLKNPLTPILTLLPLLLQKSDDPKVKSMIEKIIMNTYRMKTIIQETLTLAKLSEQGTQVHPTTFSLNDEINHIINDNKAFLDQNNVTIQLLIAEKQNVFFDKNQFYHVINNLISNAVKYTPDNINCQIVISAVFKDDHLIVSLKDNGIGLTETQQKQVFDKFFKTGSPRKGMESTGLGLSICKRIVDHHGGHIWVESPGPGKGSTFSFTIPIDST